jgi:hypothetical protein
MRVVTQTIDAAGVITTLKLCRICKEAKPLAKSFHRDCSKSDGYCNRCKVCNIAHAKKHSDMVPRSQRRKYEMVHYYGITSEQFDAMMVAQDGLCAICGGPPNMNKTLFVDHHHTTDVVRGLLCGQCNTGLGYFKDDAARLLAAAEYLKNNHAITPNKLPRKRRAPLTGKGITHAA